MPTLTANSRVSIGLMLSLVAIGAAYHTWLTGSINSRLDRVEAKVDAILIRQQLVYRPAGPGQLLATSHAPEPQQ